MKQNENLDLFIGGVMAAGILLFYVVMAIPWIFYEFVEWVDVRRKELK